MEDSGNVKSTSADVEQIENAANGAFWENLFGFGASIANNAGTLGNLFSPGYRDFTADQINQQRRYQMLTNLMIVVIIGIVLVMLILFLTKTKTAKS